MAAIIGVDIGGTFTDAVVSDGDGRTVMSKALTSPPTFIEGFLEAVRGAAGKLGLSLEELLAKTQGVYHASTIGLNALIEGRVPVCGLLTTRGHRDTLSTMGGGQRLTRMPPEVIARVSQHPKAESLVAKHLIAEIDERVVADGSVYVELNEETAAAAIQELLVAGVETIGISLLWSVRNPAHERRLQSMIGAVAPDVYTSLSSQVSAEVGEYERTVGVVLNAILRPILGGYLADTQERLRELGYAGQLMIMTRAGGLIPARDAIELPLLTLGSGPVAGLVACERVATRAHRGRARANVIATDMGGTSFDVGIVREGRQISTRLSNFGEWYFSVPSIDVRSVGSGGGSIIWLEPNSRTLRVGPESAGSSPGPACYGRGGTRPTVTDADLVLGYLNPDRFAGGQVTLDVAAARRALEGVGRPLGFGAEQVALAAVRIVDSQMADAVRLATIRQGLDPRDFDIYAFGGAGPVHACGYASELGVRRIVVPLGDFASGLSALGIIAADALVVRERALPMREPLNPEVFNVAWSELEAEALAAQTSVGIARAQIVVERAVSMRYWTQVHEIEVDAPGGAYDCGTIEELKQRFDRTYREVYGDGSGYPAAGYAVSGLTVRARAAVGVFPAIPVEADARRELRATATRSVIWDSGSAPGAGVETPVYSGEDFGAGDVVRGPAIIELPDTVIVVAARQRVTLDAVGGFVMETDGG